ncbi:MAG: osmotically inducible protein OsmC [Rhodoferax sp.]|nr:osmotically inducible protein OsmC [Rhodoferax sp.]
MDMATQSAAPRDIAAALERVEGVLRRRPESGLHDDAPAAVCWQGGTRMVASHANGTRIATDMPTELGGSGDQVTPGWLFRAGLASCAATSIALAAAARGVTLTLLEARVTSRSDARALLGLSEADGRPVDPAPSELRLSVRVAAAGLPDDALRALVTLAVGRSPIPSVVPQALPLALHIALGAA